MAGTGAQAMNTRRGRRLAAFAAVVTAAMALVVSAGAGSAHADVGLIEAEGELSDFQPATANATDGAEGELFAIDNGHSTTFVLLLWGLDPAAAGETFGTHIHVGPCVAGNGAAAGPHYNTAGQAVITPDTEVWLDFTVLPGGVAFSRTTVPFVIGEGAARSMVVHALPTEAHGPTPGNAGGRMACLPVDF